MTLRSNAKWNMFSQTFKVLVQVVNIVYLAKIIPPAEYGLMAMALVIFNFGILLRDLGTSAAIIQRKELTHPLINTVFWLNTIMGIVLAIIVFSSSPLIANFYQQPQLIPILMMLSITFPLSSCAAAHLALLERDSKFKIVSIIEVTSATVSVVCAVVLANLGYGVYSLVVQAIILNLMSAIQFWFASNWRPTVRSFIDFQVLKDVFSFSANLSLFNFVNYFSRNADSFIIGKFMSASVLGSYNLAYRIMLFPLQSLTFVTTRSLYPILSKSQDDNKSISSLYLKCVFVILFITMPLMVGLAYFSEPFVRLVFGAQWYLTADVLKWLAPTAIIQSVLSTTGSVFMAKGRTNTLLRLGIIGAILQVSSFIIGVKYSITVFAMCYFIANILNAIPVMYCLFKLIDINFKCFFTKIIPIIAGTWCMWLSLNILSLYVPIISINSVLKLCSLSITGALLYIIFMVVFSSFIRNNILGTLRKVF